MTRGDFKRLHPDDKLLWLNVERAVWRLCMAANVRLDYVSPTPPRWVTATAGIAMEEKSWREISISLRRSWSRKAGWGARYPAHELFDTVCHEVAHLRARTSEQHSPTFFIAFSDTLRLAVELKLHVDLESSVAILPE